MPRSVAARLWRMRAPSHDLSAAALWRIAQRLAARALLQSGRTARVMPSATQGSAALIMRHKRAARLAAIKDGATASVSPRATYPRVGTMAVIAARPSHAPRLAPMAHAIRHATSRRAVLMVAIAMLIRVLRGAVSILRSRLALMAWARAVLGPLRAVLVY